MTDLPRRRSYAAACVLWVPRMPLGNGLTFARSILTTAEVIAASPKASRSKERTPMIVLSKTPVARWTNPSGALRREWDFDSDIGALVQSTRLRLRC